MRKGQITPKQFDRFKKIDTFVHRKERMPVNRELCEMFNLKSTSASFLLLKQYELIKNRKS